MWDIAQQQYIAAQALCFGVSAEYTTAVILAKFQQFSLWYYRTTAVAVMQT